MQWYNILNDWFKPYQWPRKLSHLYYDRKHLTNPERFMLTVFFLVNGMQPGHIIIVMSKFKNFDNVAWRQINWIINNYPKKLDCMEYR